MFKGWERKRRASCPRPDLRRDDQLRRGQRPGRRRQGQPRPAPQRSKLRGHWLRNEDEALSESGEALPGRGRIAEMRRPLLSVIAVLACWGASGLAAPSASAADVYSFANGCYALRDMTAGRYVVREGLGYSATAGRSGRDAVSHAGDRARALPALRPRRPHALRGSAEPGRLHLHARARRRLAVGGRRRQAAARQRVHRQAARRRRRRPADPGRPAARRAGRFVAAHGLLQVPRGRGERDRPALQGLEPDRQGARLPRRSHPPRRVRVPRRALPLRPALEPLRGDGRAQGLRRPLPQRGRRGGRELHQHRAAPSAPTARRAGRASPAGRATSRSPTRAPTGSGSSAPGGPGCG